MSVSRVVTTTLAPTHSSCAWKRFLQIVPPHLAASLPVPLESHPSRRFRPAPCQSRVECRTSWPPPPPPEYCLQCGARSERSAESQKSPAPRRDRSARPLPDPKSPHRASTPPPSAQPPHHR